MPWHRRTIEFSNEWDRTRRQRLGILSSYFRTYGPRWSGPHWEDFNRGRRQADVRGAAYHDWISAQFERMERDGLQDILPPDLHGQAAVDAFCASQGGLAGVCRWQGPPPYLQDGFCLDDPEHAAYAQDRISEIVALAQGVFGRDPQGPVRLLAQAVEAGTLPREALALAPDFQRQVLALLPEQPRPAAPAQPGRTPGAQTQPAASPGASPVCKLII
jgi:hypothetical protein